MKLNTLLLTSAATLMATSVAFAADLPSKKAAPAAGSVQVCKVGGMTGFTLPGGDTCLGISGRVTVDFENGNNDNDYFGHDVLGPSGGVSWRLMLDARSNSEIGVVRSFIRMSGEEIGSGDSSEHANVDKAYVQFGLGGGNLTAGLKDSIADIAGTQGELFGSGWSQPAQGVDYQIKVGGLNLGFEVGDGLSEGNEGPDFIGHLSGSAGGVGFALAAAMTDDGVESGSAFMASANVAAGPAKFFAWGGMADGADASEYISSIAGLNDVVTYGAGVTFTVSNATSISVQAVHWEDDTANSLDLNSYGVFVSHALAKNLYIQPEVLVTDGAIPFAADADNTVGYMLRIKRDF